MPKKALLFPTYGTLPAVQCTHTHTHTHTQNKFFVPKQSEVRPSRENACNTKEKNLENMNYLSLFCLLVLAAETKAQNGANSQPGGGQQQLVQVVCHFRKRFFGKSFAQTFL